MDRAPAAPRVFGQRLGTRLEERELPVALDAVRLERVEQRRALLGRPHGIAEREQHVRLGAVRDRRAAVRAQERIEVARADERGEPVLARAFGDRLEAAPVGLVPPAVLRRLQREQPHAARVQHAERGERAGEPARRPRRSAGVGGMRERDVGAEPDQALHRGGERVGRRRAAAIAPGDDPRADARRQHEHGADEEREHAPAPPRQLAALDAERVARHAEHEQQERGDRGLLDVERLEHVERNGDRAQ